MVCCENFFRSLKKERGVLKNDWTREEARKGIIDYIEMFYNSNRQHSCLGYLSPQEFGSRKFMKNAA